ncbi:hypothetical protein [Chengkuizengella sediminis]|nr:hypothetical protein [Chengkuizengella sediminis]
MSRFKYILIFISMITILTLTACNEKTSEEDIVSACFRAEE